MKWTRAEHGPIEGNLIDYLEGLIETQMDKGNLLKVCVGTDSQKSGKGYKYATAIVLEIKEPFGLEKNGEAIFKNRGAMIVVGTSWEEGRPKINERMMKEVNATVMVGYEIYALLDLYDVQLELHADVNQNPKHDSNIALKSAIGYMSGINCQVRVKPDAYAASTAADKFCNAGKKPRVRAQKVKQKR